MSTYTRMMYHVVFGAKNRVRCFPAELRREFFAYAVGTVRGIDCFVHRINCVDDHLHILVGLHPSLAIADFVKKFKESTGNWLRGRGDFPAFRYWQEGYGAFTESWGSRERLIQYIMNQEEHHRHESFVDELKRLVEEAGLEWNEKYLP